MDLSGKLIIHIIQKKMFLSLFCTKLNEMLNSLEMTKTIN